MPSHIFDVIHGDRCESCLKIVKRKDFSDDIAFQEFRLTGLCEECQAEETQAQENDWRLE